MAVAAVAGFAADKPGRDNDSVDWMISSDGALGTASHPRLDVQLKSISAPRQNDHHILYPLKLKNYEDLRILIAVRRILAIVTLPADINDALNQTEHEMALRHCGYWISLRDYPETQNRKTVTINVPRTQRFTPEALRNIMLQIDKGTL
jgi:hypothetical protein